MSILPVIPMLSVKKEIYSTFDMGEIQIRYLIDEEKRVGLSIIPKSLSDKVVMDDRRRIDPLVQVKIAGDAHSTGYSNGASLRNSATVRHALQLWDQSFERNAEHLIITTTLRDTRGIEAIHKLTCSNKNIICCDVSVKNGSAEKIIFEMLESFNISDITPFEATNAAEKLSIFRMRAEWQGEGMLEETTPERLMLVPAPKRFAVLSERFGQLGIKPVKKYAPFIAVRDNERGVMWGGMLSIGSSWQIELYRRDNGLVMAGGIADADVGSWLKELQPEESFSAPTAFMTVCEGDIDDLCDRFVQFFDDNIVGLPQCEEELPIQYNEYRSTIGQPTRESVLKQGRALQNRGFKYFVIDAGWQLGDTGKWYEYTGDWNVNERRFPNGLKPTVDELNKMGYTVGVWVEPDTCGEKSEAFNNLQDHLAKRYGKVLTCGRRRFWDLSDPWAKEYLHKKIIGLMKKEGLGYIKLDSNESLGAGIDGAESLGEALRRYSLEMEEFYKSITQEIPEAVIENVSAGGARGIFSFTSISSMTSFSDSFDTPNNPVVAANMLRLIPARQNLIWCVLNSDYDEKRVRYSLCSATLGRFCLSGDAASLNVEQNRLLDEAIAFYKKCVPIIKSGHSRRFGPDIQNPMCPKGWQAILRRGKQGGAIVTLHTFVSSVPEIIEIPLGSNSWKIDTVYARDGLKMSIENEILSISGMGELEAVALLLKES